MNSPPPIQHADSRGQINGSPIPIHPVPLRIVGPSVPIQRTDSRTDSGLNSPTDSPRRSRREAESDSAPNAPGSWGSKVVISAIGIAALAGELMSAPTLIRLAESVGFSYIDVGIPSPDQPWRFWLSWMLPLVLDLYANLACLIWLIGYPRYSHRTVKWALANTVLAFSLSMGCLAMEHVATTRQWHMEDALWLVIAVSVIPALMVGLSVHLGACAIQDLATIQIRLHEVRTQIAKALATPIQTVNPDVNPDHAPAPIQAPESSPESALESPPNLPTDSRVNRPRKPAVNRRQIKHESPRESDADLRDLVGELIDESVTESGTRPGRKAMADALKSRGHKVGPNRAGALMDSARPDAPKPETPARKKAS